MKINSFSDLSKLNITLSDNVSNESDEKEYSSIETYIRMKRISSNTYSFELVLQRGGVSIVYTCNNEHASYFENMVSQRNLSRGEAVTENIPYRHFKNIISEYRFGTNPPRKFVFGTYGTGFIRAACIFYNKGKIDSKEVRRALRKAPSLEGHLGNYSECLKIYQAPFEEEADLFNKNVDSLMNEFWDIKENK